MKRISFLLVVLMCILFTYGSNSAAEIQSLAKDQVEYRFLKGDRPIKYYSNILILLQGFPSKQDSAIFNELIDTLNVLVDKWDVALIPNGTSNMTVEINLPHTGDWKNFFHQNNNQREIIKSTIYLDLPDSLSFNSRKKIIYYNILRSLVVANADQKEAKKVPGSVFSESKAENITFHPVDFEIIRELYSSKYEYKPTLNRQTKSKNRFEFMKLGEVIALILAMAYLIILAQKGIFTKHNFEFGEYLKQGVFALFSLVIFAVIISLSSLIIDMPPLRIWLSLGSISVLILFIGIISIIAMYFIERLFLFKKDNFILEVVISLMTTLFIPISLLLGVRYFIINTTKLEFNVWTWISSFFIFVMIIAIARAFYVFMSKRSENIIRKKDLELAQMSELHKQAELQSLRAKINPHFLYNSLNSIASLASTDARKTEQMALALSDFFKYSINREQKQMNSLSEELSAIRTYLEIEKVRFGDRLNFEIDCPDELLTVQIPQLLIQPLVENAIKHGLSQITDKGKIGITVFKENSFLKIRICDNGPAFPDGPVSGFGIRNTQERISLIYGEKASINWQNGDEKFIEIRLPL